MTKAKTFRLFNLLYNAGLGITIVVIALRPDRITTNQVFLLTGLTFVSLVLTFINRRFENKAKTAKSKKDSSNGSINSKL